MQQDAQSFPLSAKQIAQIPALGETLRHGQWPVYVGLTNRDCYTFLLMFWFLLFPLHTLSGPQLGSAFLLNVLNSLTQYYRISEVGRGL